MKNKSLIIIALAFAVVMALAAILYPKLSEEYAQNPPTESTTKAEDKANYAPDFTVYDSEMNEVKLSDFKGKPVVVNFWASWCGPCKSELPAFDEISQKYSDDVVFLMVNLSDGYNETPERIKEFIYHYGYKFPVYYDIDQSAAYAYDVSSIPQTVFINPDGTIFYSRIGAMNREELENGIANITGKTK